MTFLDPLCPFLKKTVKDTKNAWSNFLCIFHKESNEKKTHQNRMTNKKVSKIWAWPIFTPL